MHVDTGIVVVGDVAEAEGTVVLGVADRVAAQRGSCRACSMSASVAGDADFLKRVPLSAGRTFPNPLRRLLAAVGAYVCDLIFCHNECKVTNFFLYSKKKTYLCRRYEKDSIVIRNDITDCRLRTVV